MKEKLSDAKKLQKLIRISRALSGESRLETLLEMILTEARRFTRAQAGSLFLADWETGFLTYRLTQNEKLDELCYNAANFAPIPLKIKGRKNRQHVSAYVANTGRSLNIPDVYQTEEFDFSGPRLYDQATGFRTKSMLVVPLKDHQGVITGGLQLINAQNRKGKVVTFSPYDQRLVKALASQAAIALEKTSLLEEISELFESFIQAIALAIDEKSRFTGGHIARVVELTLYLAEAVNRSKRPPWDRIEFSPSELKELRYAAWMHDIGKISVPEYILDKGTRLQGFYDHFETIAERFKWLKETQKPPVPGQGAPTPGELETELDFLEKVNRQKTPLKNDELEELQKLGSRELKVDGERVPLLTPEELRALSVREGNLLPEEKAAVQNHTVLTYEMLSRLPFPRDLRNVPLYASCHHERPNGEGYHRGLKNGEIPLQARIIAVADVFEALTAPDRPYKKPLSLSTALSIMVKAGRNRELDPDLVELFLSAKLYLPYGQKYMTPGNLDLENLPPCPEELLRGENHAKRI